MPESTELTDGVVTLRPWTVDDAGFFLDACRDAEIRRFWLRETLETIDDAIAASGTAVARWAEYRNSDTMKGLAFLIAETASGAPSGLRRGGRRGRRQGRRLATGVSKPE